MAKIVLQITFLFIFILSPFNYPQNFDVGLVGGSITNLEDNNQSKNYSNFIQYGATVRYNFKNNSPFSLGFNLFISKKNLQDVNQPGLYYQVDATLINADLPLTYNFISFKDISLLAGLSFGVGNLNISSSFRGAIPVTVSSSVSKISWSLEPKLEFISNLFSGLKVSLSTGYFISTFKFEDNEYSVRTSIPGSISPGELPKTVNELSFNSLHFYLGLLYQL